MKHTVLKNGNHHIDWKEDEIQKDGISKQVLSVQAVIEGSIIGTYYDYYPKDCPICKKIKHVEDGICMYKDCQKPQLKKSHYCSKRHLLAKQ